MLLLPLHPDPAAATVMSSSALQVQAQPPWLLAPQAAHIQVCQPPGPSHVPFTVVYAADMMEMNTVSVLHLRRWTWQSMAHTDILTMAALSQLGDLDPQPPPQRCTQTATLQVTLYWSHGSLFSVWRGFNLNCWLLRLLQHFCCT